MNTIASFQVFEYKLNCTAEQVKAKRVDDGRCVQEVGCFCFMSLQLFHSSRSRLLNRATMQRGSWNPLTWPTPSSLPIANSMVTLPGNRDVKHHFDEANETRTV